MQMLVLHVLLILLVKFVMIITKRQVLLLLQAVARPDVQQIVWHMTKGTHHLHIATQQHVSVEMERSILKKIKVGIYTQQVCNSAKLRPSLF